MISAIILAAGSSQRMGKANKLLLPFRETTILEQVITNVLAAQPYEVIVVLGHEAERVKEHLSASLHIGHFDRISFVKNEHFASGMTSSIQAGIRTAAADTQGYMICLSDLPFIEPEEYLRIMVGFRLNYVRDQSCIVLPVYEQRRGNPVIFSSFYQSHLLGHDEPEGCRGIVRAYADHLVKVEMETEHVLRDLDTPEAYEASLNT